jgi:hypothetical protein
MPEYFRRYDGWYEEDCEWAIAVVQASSSYWVSMLDDFSLNQRDVAFLLKPLGERELLYWQDSATRRRISIAQSGWRGREIKLNYLRFMDKLVGFIEY